MTAARRPHPTSKIYLHGQLAGWGGFLILRLYLTAFYCSKTPGTPLLDAWMLETGSHLFGALWSHFTWRWINYRDLIRHGYRRLTIEGAIIANLGTIPLVLATWYPSTAIYATDFTRFGTWPFFWMIVGQNTLITTLWFWSLIALIYFDRVRQLEVAHADARAAAREAQLHALRGQVNPHFLFNSFNSLRALIALDPARASDALTHLSGLLRYSLTSADRVVVPLAEELQIVQRYLDLEKLRLGERLTVVAELPGHLDGAVVPPMLLQGLVENAVKFGPAARKAGGEIVYSVTLTGHRLLLRVTNPGHLATTTDSTALGLRNLRDRLRLLYGDVATFTLREGPGTLVVAEVEMPAHPPASIGLAPALSPGN